MQKPSILGLAQHISLIEKNVSCTGNLLSIALKESENLVGILDVEISKNIRRYLIAKNYAFNMEKWRFKYHLDTQLRDFRSNKIENILSSFNQKYDAIIQIGSEFDASMAAHSRSKPVLSYHDSNLAAYLKGSWNLPDAKPSIKHAMAYEKNVYDRLDGIMTMSKYLKRIFIEEFQLPEDKVHYVGVGSNLGQVVDFDKTYNNNTILFVARHLFKQKGGEVLLKAFKKVRKSIPDARLILVGQDLNIDETGVEVIPFIDKSTEAGMDRIKSIYRNADIFVMPTYYDAFGNVFLEAMANKLPCIGTNSCSMPEIIKDNQCGEVIEPGDHEQLANYIIDMLTTPDLLVTYGANGFKAISEEYSWDVVSQRTCNVVNKALR